MIHKPVVTKLWINRRACEDRDEWTEEARAHCERCHDDKTETSEVQAARIRQQRSHGDSLAALQGRHIQITVDKGLPCTRENDEEQGQRACRLLGDRDVAVLDDTDSVRGGTLVREAVQTGVSAPKAWKCLRLVFLKKPDAQLEKGLRRFRAIAL